MRTCITLLLLISLLHAGAQRKKTFFNTVYFSAMAGNEESVVDKNEWKNMYANRPQIPYQLDTMSANFIPVPKDGFYYINIHGAGGITLGKILIGDKPGWWHNKALEWRSGFVFKSSFIDGIRAGGYTNLQFPVDTTKPSTQNVVQLSQSKKILEWQNMINFKTGAIGKTKFRFNIGSGFGISRTLKNVIKERYSQTIYTWNTSLHYFMNQSGPYTETSFKAKPETRLFYLFYMGTELKLSSHASLLGDFHYTLAHNKHSSINPKAEGYWLGLTVSYSFN